MDQKIDLFDKVDIPVLTIFGVKKVVFWIFSKLFKSSRGIVYEFSLTLIGILLVVLSAPKVDKWNDPRNQNFSTKNWPIMAILIGHLFFSILVVKKIVFWTISKLFWICLGSLFLTHYIPYLKAFQHVIGDWTGGAARCLLLLALLLLI